MSIGLLGEAGREITIPEGAAGRRQRLVVLLICSSSLFVTYLDRSVIDSNTMNCNDR